MEDNLVFDILSGNLYYLQPGEPVAAARSLLFVAPYIPYLTISNLSGEQCQKDSGEMVKWWVIFLS